MSMMKYHPISNNAITIHKAMSIVLFQAMIAAVLCCPTYAGRIDSVSVPVEITTVPTLLTFGINNDEIIDSNFISYELPSFTLTPFDFVFSASPTSGVSEYSFAITIRNFSPNNWTGYKLEVGLLSGGSGAIVPLTELDFDTPDLTTLPTILGGNPAMMPAPNIVLWQTPIVINAGPSAFFAIDVPDNGNYDFILRHTPLAIPEPASLPILVVVFAAGIHARQRCRNHL